MMVMKTSPNVRHTSTAYQYNVHFEVMDIVPDYCGFRAVKVSFSPNFIPRELLANPLADDSYKFSVIYTWEDISGKWSVHDMHFQDCLNGLVDVYATPWIEPFESICTEFVLLLNAWTLSQLQYFMPKPRYGMAFDGVYRINGYDAVCMFNLVACE